MELVVVCQICGERIAKIDTDIVSYPINGSMFTSLDPDHGYPNPFDNSLGWEDLRCVYGRIHRPFFVDNEILTSAGVIVLPKDGGQPFLIEAAAEVDRSAICDRSFGISEEEAARISREEISGKTEEGAGEQDSNQPVEEKEKETVKARRKRR